MLWTPHPPDTTCLLPDFEQLGSCSKKQHLFIPIKEKTASLRTAILRFGFDQIGACACLCCVGSSLQPLATPRSRGEVSPATHVPCSARLRREGMVCWQVIRLTRQPGCLEVLPVPRSRVLQVSDSASDKIEALRFFAACGHCNSKRHTAAPKPLENGRPSADLSLLRHGSSRSKRNQHLLHVDQSQEGVDGQEDRR